MYHGRVQPRLVDAAETCFARLGLARTTIDDVAREARVSRATVYRHVRDRDELVLAVFAREADRFLAAMAAAGVHGLADGILHAVREVPGHPLLVDVMRNPPAGAWDVCVERARANLPGLDDDAVEWVLRIVLSLLTVPSDRTEDELRLFLERFVPVATRS
jgi:AcrR family transcriptional regulator